MRMGCVCVCVLTHKVVCFSHYRSQYKHLEDIALEGQEIPLLDIFFFIFKLSDPCFPDNPG